jgi:hypothetical protein
LPGQEIPDEAVELAPSSVREWKILDPAVGSGHFLVVALGLLMALFQEEARHRGLQDAPEWSERAILEHLLAHTLHGIDIDPRAVQIAAASLWLKGKALSPGIEPENLNLVAPNLRLTDLPDDDPALVELRADIEAETGIAREFTSQILQALRGADHLGSLLKIDRAVDHAIEQQEQRLKQLSAKAQQVQPDFFNGMPPVQDELDFLARDTRADLQDLLEQFLDRHSSASDLGLRLYGEQLSTGVRFIRMLKESAYHLSVANPPYQGTSKIDGISSIANAYPAGKGDLCTAFISRSLELAVQQGISMLLTRRNWTFSSQYEELRELMLAQCTFYCIGDFEVGAFEDIGGEVVSVCATSLAKGFIPVRSIAQKLFREPGEGGALRTQAKKSRALCHSGIIAFSVESISRISGKPLLYWWDNDFISLYAKTPKIGDASPAKFGVTTGDDTRFTRLPYEVLSTVPLAPSSPYESWAPIVMGAKDFRWIEPLRNVVLWKSRGLQVRIKSEHQYGSESKQVRNQDLYFLPGVAFSMIGSNFAARKHRFPSVIGAKGSSLYPKDVSSAACSLNSSKSVLTICDLNQGTDFQVGDVNRLPAFTDTRSDEIFRVLDESFSLGEARREPSLEYICPGPSPWRQTQEWAQEAVDRPEGAPLPQYTEELDPEPPTDHLSFALGVALGRFGPVDEQGQPTTSNRHGILDPTTADLSHALPAGILFLDGSLEENDHRDDLGQQAAAPLHQAWERHGAAIAPNRNLRDWLRLDFFKDVHKGMYENRPIHWPLSSAKKTFVAWVNIHRMNGQILKVLLADHLIHGSRSRIEGELADLRQVRDSEDRQAARKADSRISKLTLWLDELNEFISAVEQCADHGAPPTDGRCPAREQDAIYDPDLDDGVMINSAALWPLLEPQWKDPKKWWKELASSQGKKDYDWAHLAMRYWPTRVDEKCQRDPSLAVAHGCFWRYHPERAWAWELRLQQEIAPDFRIEEAPYLPGGKELGDEGDAPHRLAWLSEHPVEALAAIEKEATRRMGRGDNRQVVNEMRILEAGLWSVIPEKVAAMEQRLSEKQGEVFSLRAPDEVEGRAVVGEQSVQGGLFSASLPCDGGSPMMGREAENTPC